MFASWIVVTTMTMAVSTMSFIVVPIVAVMSIVTVVMTRVVVMEKRAQCNKSYCRSHNAVVMICACRCTD